MGSFSGWDLIQSLSLLQAIIGIDSYQFTISLVLKGIILVAMHQIPAKAKTSLSGPKGINMGCYVP